MAYKSTVRDRLLGNTGSVQSEPSSKQGTTGSYKSTVRDRLLGKTTYTEEDAQKAQSDIELVNNWIDKYTTVMKGVSDYQQVRNGRYTRDVSGGHANDIDDLISDFHKVRQMRGGESLRSVYNSLLELRDYVQSGNSDMAKYDAESWYDEQVQYREYEAEQVEVERRRGITRELATVQANLDNVNSQLADLYKANPALKSAQGVENYRALLDAGYELPGNAAQVLQDLQNLESRKKELEEEYGWAQYFAEERSQNEMAGWAQKYAGKSYGQLQQILGSGALEGTKEEDWLREYAPSMMTADDKRAAVAENEKEIALLEVVLQEYTQSAELSSEAGVQAAAAKQKQLDSQFGSQKNVLNRLQELKDENWKLGNEIAYENLNQNQDFAEKSGYVSTEQSGGSWYDKLIDPDYVSYGDPEYEYINGQREGVEKYLVQEQVKKGKITSELDDYKKYDYMKPEEVAAYNYLYATQGKDKAKEYLEYLSYTLNARKMEGFKENTAKSANGFWKGLGRSLDTVPLTLLSGAGILDAAFQKLENNLHYATTGEYAGPVDYNTDAMKYGVASSTILNTVSSNIAKATGTINLDPNKHPTLSKLLNGKSLGDVYQLGMSMVDSAAVAALSTVAGPAAFTLLGGSGGTQGMLDAVANGASDEQAITMGVLNGAFEMIFEKISLDKLLKGGSKNAIHAILTQGAVEGSEEAFTSIANTVADIVVMAEKSGWERGIAAYMEQGMTREEAEKQAFLDVAIQIGWDFVGGMLSGAFMGGGEYGISTAKTNRAEAQLKKVLETIESQTPANPVAEQVQTETEQQPNLDIDPDSVQGQIIRNMTGEQQTQQPVFVPERDSVQAQILRHWSGEEQTQNVGTREQQEQVARLSKITGREVVLFEGAPSRNGFFSRKDGKIHINVNGVDPVVQIFSHELTHSVEGAKVYNDLKMWVFGRIQQQGGNLAQMKAEKIRLYESEGEHLDSLGAEKELVAEYVSQYLLSDEQVITEVCRSKPTVGRQILNWIDRFLAKLNITSKDRAALEHAKILYAKALNQTQSSFGTQTSHAKPVAQGSNRQTVADDTAAWTEMLAFRDRIQSELTAGNITEEEYNQYSDMADQWEQELLGKSGSDLQYSLGVDENIESDYDKPISDLELRGDPRNKPRSSREWHAFNRSFANKTTGMEPGETRNVLITTAQYVYRVSADGYMTGYADEKIRISQKNREHIYEMWRYCNEFNRDGETFDSWIAAVQFGQRNDGRTIHTAGDGKPAATDDLLYDESQGGNRTGYSQGVVEDSWEIDYESLGPGAMYFDGERSYEVVETEDGLKHIELDLEEDNQNIQYSISDTSSKQDVVNGLKDILRRGGNLNELRRYVAQVERNASRAEQNAPRADQNTREAEHILRSAKQQGITVEEYLSQNWELYETESGWDPAARKALELEKNDSRQFSFAGRTALTADDSLLASAKQMQLEGVDPESIRQETGWYVGKDGMWRFEIDDSQMELSDTIHNYMRLGDLIHHEKLFAAYPDLAYVQVTFENLPAGTLAQYNRQFDSIAVSNKLTDPDVSEAFKSALVHEIQHAIQNREGFTAGASPEGWNRKIERGFDSRRSKDIRKAQETEQKLAQIQQEQPDFYQAMMELEAMTPTVPRGEVDWNTLEQMEDDPPEWQAFDARRDALQEQYGDMEVWDFMDLIHDRKRLAQVGRTGVELYYDTAGEIEARDVEYRRGYSEEQRKKNPPRLGGEDTVLAEATRLNAQAIGRTNQNKPFVIIETDILDGVLELDWIKTVKDNLRNNYPNGITVGSNDIYIDAQSRKEMTYSKYMRWIKNNDPQVYEDKLRATNNADEILQATTGWVNEGLNHPRNDKIVEFARGEVLLRVGNNDYTAEVVVGKESNGKLKLYDLINLMPTTIVAKKTAVAISENPSPGAARNTTAIFDDTVAQGEAGVKQFSVGDTQTEAEDYETTTDAVRDQLPRKALEYLKRAERKLLRDIAGVMNAHRFADRSYLQEMVREISEEYLIFGSVSQETMDDLFTQAYNRGIVVDTEFYNQFKEVKDYLRTMSVTLAQKDTQNIADWFDFRRRAFGTLRIVNEGGLPVDTAYGELHTMAPALFPESIAHPADQLLHMYEVGKSITKSEKSLRDYHSADAQTYRKWAKNDFDAAVGDIMKELKTVKRFADEKAAREAEEAEKVSVTVEETMNAYTELKQARKTYQKAMTKNLLSEHDEMQVGRLLKGEILPEHLDESQDNVKGILAVYEAKKDYERLCGIIGEYKRHHKGELRILADSYLQNAGEWVDKKIGLLYSRETMRRNIQHIVKDQKEAAAINAEFFDPIQKAEAAATRFKTEYRNRVRELKLSTKARRGDLVSEAHAVQLLGEVMDNIKVLEDARGMLRQKDGKTLAEWRAVIDDLWKNSPSLDREKIEGAVRQFRYIYDKLFQLMNEVRVRNGYEPVSYRRGYFPHFQPGGDGIMAQFGKALGISTEVNALPTTINGLTHNFRPGIQWFGNAQERLGFNTAYDAVEGFDKYIEGVASVIHQTDNIQKLRALAAQVRYRTTDEGIRQQVDAVNEKTTLTEEEKQARINEIYEHGRFSLANFVVELDEYTNLLANKKSRLDRTVEGLLGRKAYTVMKNIESRVGANMIAGNLSSALTNFIPLTQASAQLDRFSLLRGMWSALQSYRHDDGLVGMSTFLTNRRGSDPLVKTWAEKVSGVLSTPMELIDTFVSDSIVRAAYFQNLRRDMSEMEAMHQADIFAAGVMADRSKGSMPTLFESTNPIFKAFTQFQLEVNNQFSEVFKDLPRNHGQKGAAMLALVLLKYFLGAWIFDEVYEYFIGRRPALDPIDMLNNTIGDLTGYELPNILELGEGIIAGEMPSFETEKVGFGKAMTNLGTGMLEELPFSVGLGLLGVELDGGRIPVSSAIPDLSALWDAAADTEKSGKKRWKEAQAELNKLAYILPPFGGNQISKIWKGVKAYVEGGSYNVDSEGNEILQYPVYKDDPQDAFWSLVRATIMGKSALPEAQEWVESGFDSFSAKQTAIYQDLLEAGVSDREAYDTIRDLEGVTKTPTKSKEELQRQYLRDSDLPDDGKAIIYYGMLASDKDQLLLDKLTDMGAAPETVAFTLMDIQDAEDSAAERDVIVAAALTDQEKVELYRAKISDSQDADITALATVGVGFDDYLKIYAERDRLKKDKSIENKGLEFSYWVDSQNFSEKQADAIKACFGDDDAYEKYVDKGLDPDMAYELADEIDELEPMEGKRSVVDVQRWRICVDFTDNVEDQMTALFAVMKPTQYQKVEIANGFGVKPREYVSLEEVLPQYDADGNGSFKQAEITAAVDSLSCSNEIKAVLWQMTVGKNTKWKNNPYSQKIGQQVYEARQAAPKVTDEDESSFADDFSAEIAKQWS